MTLKPHETYLPEHETEQQVLAYLAAIGQTEEQHDHLWVRWDIWSDDGWHPHHRRTDIFVCNVPSCIALKAELKAEEISQAS